jgi:hypothetical protein
VEVKKKSLYRVKFINQGEVYEVFAREVYASDIMGFVTVEQLVFDDRDSPVVDPSEERLKSEFESVRRCLIPMHSVIRIDEVTNRGAARITELGDKVTPFPTTILRPDGGKGGK